jgi:WD40 repeat protein
VTARRPSVIPGKCFASRAEYRLKVIAKLDTKDKGPGLITHRVWSPDSKRVAIVQGDGLISVWDAGSGKRLALLNGHGPHWVFSVRFSAEGRQLLTAGDDDTARVWDVASGKEVCVLKGHTARVNDAVFDSRHKLVLTAGEDETARLWEISTGKALRVWPKHESAVRRAMFLDDDKRIRTQTVLGVERVWLVEDGSLVSEKNPFGTRVAFWGSRAYRWGKLYLKESANEIWSGPPGVPGEEGIKRGLLPRKTLTGDFYYYRVALTRDGKRAATAPWGNGEIQIWDIEKWDKVTGEGRFALPRQKDAVFSLAFTPDGKRLAVAYQDGSVRLWNATTGNLDAHLKSSRKISSHLKFSPDGTRLAFSSENVICLWDLLRGKEVLEIPDPARGVWCFTFAPDGKTLVSGCGGYNMKGKPLPKGATVTFWDLTTGKEKQTWKVGRLLDPSVHPIVQSVGYTPDGKTLVVAVGDQVRLWNVATGELLAVIRGKDDLGEPRTGSVAVSPDGKMLALDWWRAERGTMQLWDVIAQKELCRITENVFGGYPLAFTPDGKTLLSVGASPWNGTLQGRSMICLWDVAEFLGHRPGN